VLAGDLNVGIGRLAQRQAEPLRALSKADSLCAAGLHTATITEILHAIAPLAGEIASEDIKAVV